MLKSILALFLSLSLLLTLTACGKEPEVPETDSNAEIVSQTQDGEETDLIPSEEDGLEESSIGSLVESVAESTVDSVTAELSEPTSSVAESKISSVTQPKEETASQSTAVPSVVSQENQVQDTVPVELFQGNTTEELLSWVRTNRQKDDKALADKPILVAAKNQGTMLVASSKRKDLLLHKTLVEDGQAIGFHFNEDATRPLAEQERYIVAVVPLLANSQKNDLKSLFHAGQEGVFTATYQGMEYAYKDGYQGSEKNDRFWATAWFVKEGYVVKISAMGANAFQPWNPKWFDYFDFESITL